MLSKSTATTIIAIFALFSIAAASPVGGENERGVKRGRSATQGASSGNAVVSVDDWYDVANSLDDGEGNDVRHVKKGSKEPDTWEGGDMMPSAASPVGGENERGVKRGRFATQGASSGNAVVSVDDWYDVANSLDDGEGNDANADHVEPNNGQTEPPKLINNYSKLDEDPYSQAHAEKVLFQGEPLINENEPLPPSS